MLTHIKATEAQIPREVIDARHSTKCKKVAAVGSLNLIQTGNSLKLRTIVSTVHVPVMKLDMLVQ